TGWQLFGLEMMAVWGRKSAPMEAAAMFGSLTLLFAAPALYANRLVGGIIGAIACALLWSFFGPALWYTLKDATLREVIAGLVLYFPTMLLISSSILSVIAIIKARASAR